jgi:hypothetical protein
MLQLQQQLFSVKRYEMMSSVKLEGLGINWLWPISRHYSDICLELTEKNHKILSQGSWCHSQDLKQTPPKYKSQTLLLQPTCSVIC